MANISLELRLSDRTLAINGGKIKLDDTLFHAGVTRILNNPQGTALELVYKKPSGLKDAEEIHAFLIGKKLNKKFEIYPCPDAHYPTVSLIGRFQATIYR